MKKEKIIMKNKYVGAESISAQRNINNTNQPNANDVEVAWYATQLHVIQHLNNAMKNNLVKYKSKFHF